MSDALLDNRIKLRHVSCFLEVTRQGGVVPASKALGLSQPAVSKSLSELELILGVNLFDRSTRKLTLTTDGEIFARHAVTAAAALRQGVESLHAARNGQQLVRLGALPTVEAEVVPRAVARFVAGPMACRVHVESGPSPHLLALLRDGRLDFIVGRMASPDSMKALGFEHLYSEELAFAVRPNHPLAARKALGYPEIEPFILLMPPREAIIRPIVDAMFVAGGMGHSRLEIETVSNSFARAYALENDAIWVISRSVVARDLELGQLVQLPLDTSASHGPVGITMRSGEAPGVVVNAMLEAVRAVVNDRERPRHPF
jgi:LysR family pca operon transcriptional activator